MKKYIPVIMVCCLAMTVFVSCSTKMTSKPGSSGKTLELIIIADNNVYSGTTKQTLQNIFEAPQDGLNQPQPRFDVVRMLPADFNGNTMFQAHRNLLVLEVDPQGANKVLLNYDQWATPQVLIRIMAVDQHSLDSMLVANEGRLLQEYYNMEYKRMKKVFSQTPNVKVNNQIKEKYGFTLTFPEEFALAKTEGDFTWVRKEAKDFGLHVYIYAAPAVDGKDFEEATILDRLDTLMKQHVPGPADGSYQGTERRDFFYTHETTLGDVKGVETRGLWRLYNDFMGGPFVCYTLPSPDGKQTITLVGCVYSPSERSKMVNRRDLLMQVEGICRSITFGN